MAFLAGSVEAVLRIDRNPFQQGLDLARAEARRFANQRFDAKLGVDKGTFDQDIAQARAQLAGLGDTAVRIDVNTGDALLSVSQVMTRLEQLEAKSPVSVRVDLDGAAATIAALAALNGELTDLNQARATPSVDLDGGVAALAELAALRAALAALNGSSTRTRIDIDTNAAQAGLRQVAGGVGNVLGAFKKLATGPPAQIAALGAAALAAAPQILSLGASAVDLVGVIGVLPGAALAGAAAVGTLVVGFRGLGEALSNRDDAEAFAAALENLAPAAASFATAIRDIGPAWDGVRLDVQERLFAGLGDQMRELSDGVLPSMRSGLGGIATELNATATEFVGFASSTKTISDVDAIFRNTTAAMTAARPAAENLMSAFMDIGVVGSSMLPELAAGWTNVTGRFREFIAEARQTGELETWIRGGLDTLAQLGSVAVNTGSALSAMFDAAEASGADFLGGLDRITAKWDEWASSARGQNQMIEFFTSINNAARELVPGLVAVKDAFVDAFAARGPGLAVMTGAFSDLLVSLAPVIAGLGTFTSAVLPAVSAGVSTFSGVLIFAGTAAVGLMAVMKGFALWGTYAAAVASLGTAIAGTAALTSTLVAGLTGSLAAGSAAAAGMARFGAAVTAAGRALPLVALGAIAAGATLDALTVSTSDAVDVMSQGGAAADNMTTTLARQTGIVAGLQAVLGRWFDISLLGIGTLDSVNAALREQWAAMSNLERAQQQVTVKTREYNEAVQQFGENSSQAAAAADRLATAEENLTTEQDKAAKAAMSHTEAIQAQNDAMSSQVSTAFAYEDAVAATAEAHKVAADALAASGAESEEYRTAVTDLARGMESQAVAARASGEALGGASAGAEAYATELLRATDISTGPGRDAFVKLAGAMDSTGLAALTAAAETSGLATEIITLPDNRTVTVVAAAERSQLDSVTADVDRFVQAEHVGTIRLEGNARSFGDTVQQAVTLANGTKGIITLDGNNQPLSASIAGSKYLIDQTTGVMTIDGNPQPGQANLSGLKLSVDATTGQMTIDANPGPANAKTQAAVQFADGKTGIITIEGNPTSANGKTQAAVRLADGSRGTITIDGNQTPADGKVNATIRYANGSTGTVRVDADTARANAAIDNAARDRTATIRVNTIQNAGRASYGGLRGAEGGIVKPMADGGVLGRTNYGQAVAGFAKGGYGDFMGRQLTPMAATATVVAPDTWRVLGDNMTVPEVYAPLNGSAASLSYLRYGVQDYGMDVVPAPVARALGFADGGIAGDLRAVLDRALTVPMSGRMVAPRGQQGSPDVVRAIARLEAALSALQRSVSIDARTTNIGDTAIRRSADQAQKLRTMAGQGMW